MMVLGEALPEAAAIARYVSQLVKDDDTIEVGTGLRRVG